jgi:uncharacterized protein (UPF0333 family)
MTARHLTRRGQSTVEYLLVVSVLVIALVVAAYAFLGPFEEGYEAMTDDVGTVLSSGTRAGSGNQR